MKNAMSCDVLLSRAELARELNVCPRTVNSFMNDGMPFIRKSERLIFFRWRDVVEWLATNYTTRRGESWDD
jgi:hypothetical protein